MTGEKHSEGTESSVAPMVISNYIWLGDDNNNDNIDNGFGTDNDNDDIYDDDYHDDDFFCRMKGQNRGSWTAEHAQARKSQTCRSW